MLPTSATRFVETDRYIEHILESPERPELLRLTTLAEYLFRVPVAYLALMDDASTVVSRIGSGQEYWPMLGSFPMALTMWRAAVVRDSSGRFGDLQFAATAPLMTSSGVSLGSLVIADKSLRPDFSEQDINALSDLASVLAAKMELRLLAFHARESDLALRESERRFETIADCAPVLIICSGADGASTFVNKTWLEFTGMSLAAALADGGFASVHPSSRKIVYETYWQAFQARQPVTVEFPMRRHDGEYRWMLCRGVPRFREDNTFAGFIGTLVDFTNHYKAIAEVQKHALCTSAIAEVAGLLYLLVDPVGKVERMNAIGQSPVQDPPLAAGAYLWETSIAVLHGPEAIERAFRRATETRDVVQLHTSCEAPNAVPKELRWTMTPIVPATGELIALIAIASANAAT